MKVEKTFYKTPSPSFADFFRSELLKRRCLDQELGGYGISDRLDKQEGFSIKEDKLWL